MKRKNITIACEHCRKRRAKCDGDKPACSRCRGRSLECAYTTQADGRRPASKTHVDLLRWRIEFLEQTLRAHSISVENTLPATVEKLSFAPDQPSDETPGSLSRDALMNFEEDGEARYFGLSSGRLEFTSEMSTQGQHSPDHVVGQRSLSGIRTQATRFYQEIANEKIISGELEDELIDMYFKWEQPHVQVVDEKLFRESRDTKGRYFSPLLLNCILASASRYSLRGEVLTDPNDPSSAGQLFLEKAAVLLPFDLKSPTITTLQSCCILGNTYCATGSDAASWLHIGMAHRLALDMGLNLESLSVSSSEPLTLGEMELRKRIYWALYCIDKTSSMYTGRICTMLHSQARVSLPKVITSAEVSQTATPYELRQSTLGYIQRSQISLSRIIEKILVTLYSPQSTVQDGQTNIFITSTILELRNWYYDLPKELCLDRSKNLQSESAVYINHMLYYTAFILLMKPSLQGSQNENSRKISYQAASGIWNVQQMYRSKFGSFRQCPITATYCTLSAVLTSLSACHHQWGNFSAAKTQRQVEGGIEVLAELSISWNPAKRIRQALQRMRDARNESTARRSKLPPISPLVSDLPATKELSRRNPQDLLRHDYVPTKSVALPATSTRNADWVPSDLLDGAVLPQRSPGNRSVNYTTMDDRVLSDGDVFGTSQDFSYMETDLIFQCDDGLLQDYGSFDFLRFLEPNSCS